MSTNSNYPSSLAIFFSIGRYPRPSTSYPSYFTKLTTSWDLKSENAMTAGRNDITTQKNRTTANRARTRASKVIVSFTIEAGELEFDSLTNGTNPGSTASRSYFPPTARLALSSASVKLLIKQTSTLLSFDSRF
ncbi:hypothetical protein BHM03_00007604 [Ensete ventricosum]|nr:hypothetical protein BHM03_00007604 [Ensete ventricosum]